MKKDLFGKKRTTKEGKTFYTYLTTLTDKTTGEQKTVEVKFKESAGFPKKLPCVIEFDKKNANYSEHEETYEKDGQEYSVVKKVMWISAFTEHEYIDTSMDNFE